MLFGIKRSCFRYMREKNQKKKKIELQERLLKKAWQNFF